MREDHAGNLYGGTTIRDGRLFTSRSELPAFRLYRMRLAAVRWSTVMLYELLSIFCSETKIEQLADEIEKHLQRSGN